MVTIISPGFGTSDPSVTEATGERRRCLFNVLNSSPLRHLEILKEEVIHSPKLFDAVTRVLDGARARGVREHSAESVAILERLSKAIDRMPDDKFNDLVTLLIMIVYLDKEVTPLPNLSAFIDREQIPATEIAKVLCRHVKGRICSVSVGGRAPQWTHDSKLLLLATYNRYRLIIDRVRKSKRLAGPGSGSDSSVDGYKIPPQIFQSIFLGGSAGTIALQLALETVCKRDNQLVPEDYGYALRLLKQARASCREELSEDPQRLIDYTSSTGAPTYVLLDTDALQIDDRILDGQRTAELTWPSFFSE